MSVRALHLTSRFARLLFRDFTGSLVVFRFPYREERRVTPRRTTMRFPKILEPKKLSALQSQPSNPASCE